MKKFTLMMLLAVLVLPMSAQVLATRANGLVPQAIDNVTTLNSVMPNRDGAYVWDFEDADTGLSPFTAEDQDGDGFNWEYFNNTGQTSGLMTAHDGDGLIASASYDSDSYAALTPNNWLISPEYTLGGGLTFWAAGQDASYASEVFGVYVTVDGGSSYTQVGTDKTATGEYVLYEYDLSAYAGQTGRFAIVHHNVTDMFWLNVDDITFDPGFVVTPEPTIPTDVEVTPTTTTAEVAWTPGENNGSWNLRWRPWVDPALMNKLWDLPADGYEAQLNEGFMVYDADGDGNGWGLAYTDNAQTDLAFTSASYSGGALSPDNWLFTPAVGLGGTLKFDTWNYSSSYPDKIMVYVCDNPDWESVDEFVAVSDFIEPGTTAQSVEIDLSEYEGMGVIAFRHYDCTDQWRIYVDNIAVEIPGALEPHEWSIIEHASNPCTIQNLEPGTTYEVAVMAFNEEGDKETPWTESVIFTTIFEFTKDILGYTEGEKDHYYLIASPVGSVSAGDVVNMMEGAYDLYSFNQNTDGEAHEWINGVGNASFAIEAKQGYLYANSADVTLKFVGDPYDGNGNVSLYHTVDDVPFAGWNLVGNPFGVTAYIDRPFYVMNEAGTAIEVAERNSIDVMEGIFVYTDAAAIMTFSTEEPTGKSASLALTVNEGRGIVDRAIVRFGESSTLPKFQIFENRSSLYIPQNGKNYAVVASEGMGEMPVSFEAVNDGTYSISFNAENVEFSYLHLIDNMTGADIDLLANPSYSFDAKASDYASRFRLVFATGNANESSNFAFVSDNNIIVNGEGTLQVIDMTGRIVSTSQINGMARVNMNTTGVYVLQLINGSDVKTQKIVVK